ncbi:BTAD domain-containing putative transcriptional regulator [Streptomyces sp. NPDC053755]|uniref:AfsR/SARP family transcriptional regulator n=1 Tax=Streptomyces sp. NPDC053755 TaxID=3155815 RepID=UPI0034214179
MLHFALLGPMEIRVKGELRTPSAPMARRVLAVLLTHADRVVPMELLIDELWGESPPKRARKTVQTYVYQLRKALGDPHDDGGPERGQELLETHPYGYRLPLRDGQLDISDFQGRLREGQKALGRGESREGASALRRGLELWRGSALEGIETGPVLAAQAARLEDLRLRALEQRISADLARGRHQAILEEIRELTYLHPLHEEFCAQFMTAAQRCGQRGEALSAYAKLRGAMSEQLGLEPSGRLRELQREVLDGADERTPQPYRPQPYHPQPSGPHPEGPAPAAGAPFLLPAAVDGFVGRHHELAAIERAVTGPGSASGPRIVTVTGAPGIGKTETALQVAHRLRERFPDGQLHATLHQEDGTPQAPAEALKGLLAAVGHDRRTLPDRTEDLARAFRGWAVGRRLLLLLDDAAGTSQVLPLLPADPGTVVVVTSRCRTTGLPGSVTTVTLGPLPEAEATQLLARTAGAGDTPGESAALARLASYCEGLPFALRALGSRIAPWQGRSLADFAVRLADRQHRLQELSGPHLDVERFLLRAAARLPHGAREVLAELSRAYWTDVPVEYLSLRLQRSLPFVERSVELLADHHLLIPATLYGNPALRVAPLFHLALSGARPPRTGGAERHQTPVRCGWRALPPRGAGAPYPTVALRTGQSTDWGNRKKRYGS